MNKAFENSAENKMYRRIVSIAAHEFKKRIKKLEEYPEGQETVEIEIKNLKTTVIFLRKLAQELDKLS